MSHVSSKLRWHRLTVIFPLTVVSRCHFQVCQVYVFHLVSCSSNTLRVAVVWRKLACTRRSPLHSINNTSTHPGHVIWAWCNEWCISVSSSCYNAASKHSACLSYFRPCEARPILLVCLLFWHSHISAADQYIFNKFGVCVENGVPQRVTTFVENLSWRMAVK